MIERIEAGQVAVTALIASLFAGAVIGALVTLLLGPSNYYAIENKVKKLQKNFGQCRCLSLPIAPHMSFSASNAGGRGTAAMIAKVPEPQRSSRRETR